MRMKKFKQRYVLLFNVSTKLNTLKKLRYITKSSHLPGSTWRKTLPWDKSIKLRNDCTFNLTRYTRQAVSQPIRVRRTIWKYYLLVPFLTPSVQFGQRDPRHVAGRALPTGILKLPMLQLVTVSRPATSELFRFFNPS